MVGFWRVANRAKKIYKKMLDFMLAGFRLIVAVAIFIVRGIWHVYAARDDEFGVGNHSEEGATDG